MITRKNNRLMKRGAAVVETAVILPIGLLFVLGVAEFSVMLIARQSVAIASREGAREGARPGSTTTDVFAAVNAVMADAGYAGYTTDTNVDSIDYTDRQVNVTVTLPWDRAAITGSLFGGGTLNIASTTVMRREGNAPSN